jgi:hypothetical protein
VREVPIVKAMGDEVDISGLKKWYGVKSLGSPCRSSRVPLPDLAQITWDLPQILDQHLGQLNYHLELDIPSYEANP